MTQATEEPDCSHLLLQRINRSFAAALIELSDAHGAHFGRICVSGAGEYQLNTMRQDSTPTNTRSRFEQNKNSHSVDTVLLPCLNGVFCPSGSPGLGPNVCYGG